MSCHTVLLQAARGAGHCPMLVAVVGSEIVARARVHTHCHVCDACTRCVVCVLAHPHVGFHIDIMCVRVRVRVMSRVAIFFIFLCSQALAAFVVLEVMTSLSDLEDFIGPTESSLDSSLPMTIVVCTFERLPKEGEIVFVFSKMGEECEMDGVPEHAVKKPRLEVSSK